MSNQISKKGIFLSLLTICWFGETTVDEINGECIIAIGKYNIRRIGSQIGKVSGKSDSLFCIMESLDEEAFL